VIVVPRAKKTAGTAVDKRNGQRAVLGVVPGLKVERFDPPEGLCEAAMAAWEAFWVDRQAVLLTPSAKVVLLRWVDALDRYLRTLGDADLSPLVDGSQGQEVLNPLYRVAEQMRATVEACERQLGIGGLNASQLGLAAISEARSLQDMNARYGGSSGDGDQATERDTERDPRRRAIRIASGSS
jgi:hypothetical protein